MFCTLMQYDEQKYIEKTQTLSNPLNPNPRKWSNTQALHQQKTNKLFEYVWAFCVVGT